LHKQSLVHAIIIATALVFVMMITGCGKKADPIPSKVSSQSVFLNMDLRH